MGNFLGGLVKGFINGLIAGAEVAVENDFLQNYNTDCQQHPEEGLGMHIGHAMGATVKDLFS
jgi:hypothetical protein